MSGLGEELDRDYREALTAHLREPGEATLVRAYELGRRALEQGAGLIDLSAMHHRALTAVLSGSALQPELVAAAAAFHAELLSPFEMTIRGYRDANAQLQELNRTLVEKTDALQAVNHELEAFSYSVSHDLRAPLRSIDGFSQALLEDCGDSLDTVGIGHLQRVRAAAQRMAGLIDDLLSLSRITRATLARSRVDVSALARATLERLQRAEPTRQVEVRVEDGIEVSGDARLLGIALDNLLGNAWKFTARKSSARIELGREGATIFVRDNGAGFDMAYADKLFGVFQRLHSTREFEGTGIGLATVQRIIHRHGGRIWAEGVPGEGACFFFTLGEEAA